MAELTTALFLHINGFQEDGGYTREELIAKYELFHHYYHRNDSNWRLTYGVRGDTKDKWFWAETVKFIFRNKVPANEYTYKKGQKAQERYLMSMISRITTALKRNEPVAEDQGDKQLVRDVQPPQPKNGKPAKGKFSAFSQFSLF